MENRLKTIAFGSLAFLFLSMAVPSPASAQTAPNRRTAAARRPMARLLATPYRPVILQLRGLKLTADQRQQVIGIFKKHQPELQALRDKLRAARAAWQQAGQIDIAQRNSLNQERLAVLQAARAEILGVLTPEQKAQLQARRGRRGGR